MTIRKKIQHHYTKVHLRQSNRLVRFLQDWHALLTANISVRHSLQVLTEATSFSTRHYATLIYQAIERGELLSNALERINTLKPEHLAMIESNIHSANLVTGISLVLNDMDLASSMKDRLLKIISYPCFMLATGLTVVLALKLLMFPKLQQLYSQFGASLPAYSQHYIQFSTWLLKAIPITTLAAILCHLFLRQLQPKLIQRYLPTWLSHYRISRWTHIMASLLNSHISLNRSIKLANRSLQHRHLINLFSHMEKKLHAGERFSKLVAPIRYLPSFTKRLIFLGENQGDLANSFRQASQLTNEQMQRRIQHITKYLSPCLTLLIAGYVGGLVIAIYLPIVNMSHLF